MGLILPVLLNDSREFCVNKLVLRQINALFIMAGVRPGIIPSDRACPGDLCFCGISQWVCSGAVVVVLPSPPCERGRPVKGQSPGRLCTSWISGLSEIAERFRTPRTDARWRRGAGLGWGRGRGEAAVCEALSEGWQVGRLQVGCRAIASESGTHDAARARC
jgi:hypothetical protein